MDPIRKFREREGLEVVIRPAGAGDSCQIIDTVRSHAMERSYVLMEQYGKDPASEREYIGKIVAAGNLLAVAEAGGEVVGCLAGLQADGGARPETAHILHVGVHLREAFRGRGIGSALLAYATDWAAARGFRKLEASIFTTNQRSLRLFERAGFAREGVRVNRIRIGHDLIDEVLMGKVL